MGKFRFREMLDENIFAVKWVIFWARHESSLQSLCEVWWSECVLFWPCGTFRRNLNFQMTKFDVSFSSSRLRSQRSSPRSGKRNILPFTEKRSLDSASKTKDEESNRRKSQRWINCTRRSDFPLMTFALHFSAIFSDFPAKRAELRKTTFERMKNCCRARAGPRIIF